MDFLERFSAEGWLRIDGVFDRALIDALHAGYLEQSDSLLEAKGDRREYLRVGDDRLMLSVALRGQFLDARLYANPIILRLLEQFLGPDFLIDSFTCVSALPGAPAQRQHLDHSVLFPGQANLEASLGCYAATLVVPLVDLTPESGTTRLFPGSHVGDGDRAPAEPMMPRGSCFIMDYRLLHQGLANISAKQRPVLFIVYARAWFTDSKNFHRQARINIGVNEMTRVPMAHRPLFRRMAGKGTLGITERELISEQ